ncbi:exonuclease domain-containing protein [Streptomyces sp. NPDC052301]|uniref:3'-5' exonuclease n=1 Tax=Streptomyces sp. NPDC052301 TaxID=3365687 RepID=UPI0037D17604
MFFDSRAPEPFLDALIEALPVGWGGHSTGPGLADSYQEESRQRDLARDACSWEEFLRPGETTGFGEWLLLSLGEEERYAVTIGLLSGPDDSWSLFISSPGGLADEQGEFLRLPRASTPGEVAHALCRMARAADRRAVEKHLQEATAERRHASSSLPGGRIVVFDLETTGLDPETARIVEAAWLVADHRALAWGSVLIDPGVPIPEGAYDVHGIDDTMARNDGVSPRDAIDELTGILAKEISDGATLVIFNRVYDLPLLDAECRRHGLPRLADRLRRPVQVVDPMRISQQIRYHSDNHALSDLADLYSPGNLAAHSALGDCLATWDALVGLCRHYGEIVVRLLFQRQEVARHDEPLTVQHLLACSNVG